MKKTLTIAALALGLLPVKAQDTAYKITGSVPADVKTVYLGVMNARQPVDSATVTDGKFTLDGTLPKDEIMLIITGIITCRCSTTVRPLILTPLTRPLTVRN